MCFPHSEEITQNHTQLSGSKKININKTKPGEFEMESENRLYKKSMCWRQKLSHCCSSNMTATMNLALHLSSSTG